MLTQQEIMQNKADFIALLSNMDFPEADITGLINFLESSDFFTAPASSQYNCAFEGGLCLHSLSVYFILNDLVSKYAPNTYSTNTLKIVGLLHDLYKTNFYESYVQNKKVYCPTGSKQDNLGTFDWVSVPTYKVKESNNRYIMGDNSFTTYMLVSRYIPLTEMEIAVLVNQNCGMDNGYANKEIFRVLEKFPLAALVHSADLLSHYTIEKHYE